MWRAHAPLGGPLMAHNREGGDKSTTHSKKGVREERGEHKCVEGGASCSSRAWPDGVVAREMKEECKAQGPGVKRSGGRGGRVNSGRMAAPCPGGGRRQRVCYEGTRGEVGREPIQRESGGAHGDGTLFKPAWAAAPCRRHCHKSRATARAAAAPPPPPSRAPRARLPRARRRPRAGARRPPTAPTARRRRR